MLLAGGFCAEVAFCSFVAVPAADCEPAPTLLDGVWLLTGGVAVELLLGAALAPGLLGLVWACELSGVVVLLGAAELGFADVPVEA